VVGADVIEFSGLRSRSGRVVGASAGFSPGPKGEGRQSAIGDEHQNSYAAATV
jgi:hypothetical protein